MIEVLYVHDDFVVAIKPQGVDFHSQNGAGFVVQLSQQLGRTLWGVHRLDTLTSGLMLFATSAGSAARFGTMFEAHEIEKYYLALSLRKPKKKQGWVKGDMTKARRGDYKLLTSMENPAVTQFISVALRTHERLFLVKPHTGKTHQIRVALKSLGAPIAGDARYAHAHEAALEERGYLHAYALRFVWAGKSHSFVNIPDEGERFLSAQCQTQLSIWAQPWEFFA